MNALNILLVVLLVAAAIRGWFKGMVAMAVSVFGMIAGIVLCRMFAGPVATWIGSGDGHMADVAIAHVILFAIGYFGVLCAGKIIRSAIHALHLGIIDRLGGTVFSVLEVALVVSLVFNLWNTLLPDSAPATADTPGMRGFLYNVAPAILGYLK